ncbi:MAG: branched-chain amino acid ABC transporter permease [candidate division Zixibacteria bacterium]|nr:branched-chain amino acid ABC transporter permease [candidate division Zixibacteria bacterium]
MKRLAAFIGFFLLFLLANRFLPEIIDPYYLHLFTLSCINVILAVSLNLINGTTGQFSLGHAGFMAVGGYTSASLTFYLGPKIIATLDFLPAILAKNFVFLFALLGGGLSAAFLGLLVGIPSLRLRGDYLAIVTLGMGEIVRVLILNVEAIGGARGFSDIPAYTNLFWIISLTALTIAAVASLTASSHGRAFLSVREDEIAAEAMGVNTTYYKVIAFVIGAFFAGMAGCLFGHYLQLLHPNSFTFLKSFEIIIMIIVGGLGSIFGAVVAAVILTLLPEALRYLGPVKDWRMVIYSLALIILMITRPQGLFGNWTPDFRRWWPFRKPQPVA